MSTYRVAVFTGEKTIEFKELELKKPLVRRLLSKLIVCALCNGWSRECTTESCATTPLPAAMSLPYCMRDRR